MKSESLDNSTVKPQWAHYVVLTLIQRCLDAKNVVNNDNKCLLLVSGWVWIAQALLFLVINNENKPFNHVVKVKLWRHFSKKAHWK